MQRAPENFQKAISRRAAPQPGRPDTAAEYATASRPGISFGAAAAAATAPRRTYYPPPSTMPKKGEYVRTPIFGSFSRTILGAVLTGFLIALYILFRAFGVFSKHETPINPPTTHTQINMSGVDLIDPTLVETEDGLYNLSLVIKNDSDHDIVSAEVLVTFEDDNHNMLSAEIIPVSSVNAHTQKSVLKDRMKPPPNWKGRYTCQLRNALVRG